MRKTNEKVQTENKKKNGIAVSVRVRIKSLPSIQLITLTRKIGSELKVCSLKNSSWQFCVKRVRALARSLAFTSKGKYENWTRFKRTAIAKLFAFVFAFTSNLIRRWRRRRRKEVMYFWVEFIRTKSHSTFASSSRKHRHQIKLLFTWETEQPSTCLNCAKFSTNVSRFPVGP